MNVWVSSDNFYLRFSVATFRSADSASVGIALNGPFIDFYGCTLSIWLGVTGVCRIFFNKSDP